MCPRKKAHLSVCPRVTQLIWISVVSAAASLAPTLSTSLQAPSFCLKVSADSWVFSLSFLADTQPTESPLRVSPQPPSTIAGRVFLQGPGASVLPQAALEVPRSNQQWGHTCRTGLPVLMKLPKSAGLRKEPQLGSCSASQPGWGLALS